MRVLVTGAYGLIGAACLARLHAAGHEVVAAGRSLRSARRRFSYAQWIAADFGRLGTGAAWEPLLQGVDAVVNCVGVLQDGLRDDVQQVQLEGTKALFDGCVRAGVKRLVHVSAIGAEADGPSAFSRSKAAAEAYLTKLPLDWVILRPALVLGSAVYGGTAMLRAIAAFPGIVPIIQADARLQIIGLDDLAETLERALAPNAPGRVVWEVAHPQVHSLAEIVTAIRGWLGFAPGLLLPLPRAVGKIVAGVADALGFLGWRSPARTTALAQLTAGVVGDPAAWMAATGIVPKSLDQILAARPASVQDRWFARLYLLKPLAVAGLAVAAVVPNAEQLATLLGFRPSHDGVLWWLSIPRPMLPGAASSAIALLAGLSLLFRPAARFGLIVLLAVTLLQIVDHWVRPWIYLVAPLDAVAFKLPMVLAILFSLAILDDR
ncbi:MAG: NAD(P)H-binding protein [Xanthobacteraceae bacterium]